MGMLDKVKENQVTVNALQYKHLIAGRPKSGKTSLFHGIVKKKYDGDMSKGLLIAFERGYQALSGIHAIDIESWEDFQELVEELVDNKSEVSYEILALDTIDVLINRATAYMLHKQSIKDKKNYSAVNDLAYGKGYELLERTIADEIDKLDQAGYNLMFITHDKDKTFTQKDGLEYDKTVISAGGRAGDYFKNSADMIHFIDITKEVEKGKKVDKRYIYFRGDGELEAGSRFPQIVKKVEYSVDNFINAIEDAIKAEYEDTESMEEAKEEQAQEKEEQLEKQAEESNLTAEELIAQIDEGLKPKTVQEKKAIAGLIKDEFGVGNYKKFENTEDLKKVLKMVK